MAARKARSKLDVDDATSRRMGRIRQRDTAPELAVRRLLFGLGHRYRTSNRDLPGAPDVANRTQKWALFVHGCFWHAHESCSKATLPKRNRKFWEDKLAANRARDERALQALKRLGYRVVVVWQCELKRPAELATRLSSELSTIYDRGRAE